MQVGQLTVCISSNCKQMVYCLHKWSSSCATTPCRYPITTLNPVLKIRISQPGKIAERHHLLWEGSFGLNLQMGCVISRCQLFSCIYNICILIFVNFIFFELQFSARSLSLISVGLLPFLICRFLSLFCGSSRVE